MLMNDVIKRRIIFVLDAAKHENVKDHSITYTLRALSNYATIGKDAGSAAIKKINKRVSENAYELLKTDGLEVYCKETINEHPKPIKQTWEWLKKNSDNGFSIEKVWKEFCDFPMVTVTKEEDKLIRGKGLNSKGTVEERYSNIKIITLPKSPFELSE
jgi:hypothetical protein